MTVYDGNAVIPFTFVSAEGLALWSSLKDANMSEEGVAILEFAQRWAWLMEAALSDGETIQEVWIGTSTEANLEGLRSYHEDVAIKTLVQVWVHGAELKRVNNAFWGYPDAEGIASSTVMTVGV